MLISFTTRKLKTTLEDDALRQRQYGVDMAKKIRLRLAALGAADSLVVFWPPKSGPERCHELGGDLAGRFSVDLKQPYRLLFVPTGLEGSSFAEERERWAAIKAIAIVSIEDTHG